MSTRSAAPTVRRDPLASNRSTVDGYEVCAREYAENVPGTPTGVTEAALRRLVQTVPPAGLALEIGSGPGTDADYIEMLGVRVRRTEPTQSFRDIQAERGKVAEPLDVLVDELGGPYDAVLAMCVLQHIDRSLIDGVLQDVSRALRPGAGFLISVPEGSGEYWERGSSGDYHVVLWEHDALTDRLAGTGLIVEWSARTLYADDDPWMTLLARRSGGVR